MRTHEEAGWNGWRREQSQKKKKKTRPLPASKSARCARRAAPPLCRPYSDVVRNGRHPAFLNSRPAAPAMGAPFTFPPPLPSLTLTTACAHPADWFLAPNTLSAIPQRLQSTISPLSRHEFRAKLAPFQPVNSLPRLSSIIWVYQLQIKTPLSTDGYSHLCSPTPFRLRRFVAPQSVTSNPRQAS